MQRVSGGRWPATAGRGTARAEDAQETSTQIHTPLSTLVYEDTTCQVVGNLLRLGEGLLDVPSDSGLAGRCTARAEDAQETSSQSDIPPSTLVYEDTTCQVVGNLLRLGEGLLDLPSDSGLAGRCTARAEDAQETSSQSDIPLSTLLFEDVSGGG